MVLHNDAQPVPLLTPNDVEFVCKGTPSTNPVPAGADAALHVPHVLIRLTVPYMRAKKEEENTKSWNALTFRARVQLRDALERLSTRHDSVNE